ncbi:putative T7SS-secreted protein [Streptomyces virginiae]|uniref:putative T7SS-secreted protein n=1 Tax=Streptomyces virginiae TaxID=1961 RepID=UPI00380A0061
MVDFGGWVDKGLGKLEEGWDAGKKLVGEGVDKATDVVGDGLEYVGAEDWADAVEDWGDSTASSLGATVGEQQLGQTEQADELIHGKVSDINASVKNLRDFKSAFDSVGQGMKGLDSSHWKGAAADSFREKFQTLPTDWLHAADAFEGAAKALETYATTVTWAQGRAKEAIDLYKQGQEASKNAADDYKKKVAAYEDARTGDKPLPRPECPADPGAGVRDRAQEILNDARRQRDEAADTANKAVTAALAHAPAMPSATDRAKLNFVDWGVSQGVEMLHLSGGVVKGVVGITNFVRSVDPLDPYNITHPADYYKNMNMTLAGLASTAAHPDRALKSAWDAAKGDPSEFIGRLIPELIGTKGAGGVKSIVSAGLKNTVKHGADDAVRSAARKSADEPAKVSRTQDAVENGPTDPIDLATGVMYLPQRDLVLPAVLPLVFRRRVASDYRAGRWFGPSWSSTVDQRLEIDSEGVVFVCDDGLLLTYPHPAPGVPVMPSHGPRWPLDRAGDDYTISDPDTGRVRHFTAGPGGLAPLAQIDDRHGNWIAFEYDTEGNPLRIVHSAGYRLDLTTSAGRITALHLAGGAPDGSAQEIRRYGYDGGNLTEVVNSSGKPMRFAYDDRARVTSWTDTNGSRYDYIYDDRDRCTAQGGADGHLSVRIDYDGTDPETGLRVTTTTTGSGAVHRYVVNDAHQIVQEVNPLGAVTRYERDRYNRLLGRTDTLGRTYRFSYDLHGRLVGTVRPDGRESTAEYNELGFPTRVVNPDRTTIRQEYDARGNRTSVTDPSGAVTRYMYDEVGRLTGITDALGHTSRISSNAAGLPVEITDPLGATTRLTRDPFGRTSVLTDPLGNKTHLFWTPEGRLARRIEADGSEESWTYDGEGNCLTHVNAVGAVSRFEYTHFDLLVARTGADGVRYAFTYDHELRLIQVRNAQGATWDYEYDAAGCLVSETDFDGRPLTYQRDAVGRITARTDALGQTLRYAWDDLDRIVTKDAAGAVSRFAYDFSGRLAEAVNGDARVAYLRDRNGHLLSESVDGREVRYTYDELGRRIGRTTPAGAVSAWAYDPAGRRSVLTTAGRTVTFDHDAAGRETARHVGEVTLASEFDQRGRLSSQQVTGAGRRIQRRDYAYRTDGYLIGIHDELSGPQTFQVDPGGRVTAVRAADWTERYAYDESGNQTEASWPASHPGQEATGTRDYSGTTLTRAGKVRYEYDALGRTILRQVTRLSRKPDTWHYAWDADNRLTEVTTPDGTRWRYSYDALGRRTVKRRLADDGTTVVEQITFTWDGDTLCEQSIEDPAHGDRITLSWDHHGLRPLTQMERRFTADAPQAAVDERFFSIVTDLVGAPRELVDESGRLAWHTRTTVWGTTTWAASSTAYTPIRFPGQYFDPETGLHYNYFRYYDPESGRYASPDPLGISPAPNPTTYVRNPHRLADPMGLFSCTDVMDYMEDNAIPAGDPVTHGPTATLIGSDGPSTRNFQNVLNAGEHDVVAHGSRSGFLEMPHGDVNAGQLVDAVRNNPHYNGGPLRLMVCHSGSDAAWTAQRIANELGTTVRAPTDRAGTNPALGPGQVPQVDNGGYWRVFLPMLEG